jgi:phosphatidylserine/phosphatidylglycerophosphate/cardiolipin synthase-like enzyme
MKLVDLVKNYRNSSPLKITIVSPFVSEGFIKTVVEELSPNKMLVVADKRSELEMDKIDKIAKVEVRLAECLDGLVHAKLFLFDWKDGAKFFVWGSANATQSAFGKNAESVSLLGVTRLNAGYIKGFVDKL